MDLWVAVWSVLITICTNTAKYGTRLPDEELALKSLLMPDRHGSCVFLRALQAVADERSSRCKGDHRYTFREAAIYQSVCILRSKEITRTELELLQAALEGAARTAAEMATARSNIAFREWVTHSADDRGMPKLHAFIKSSGRDSACTLELPDEQASQATGHSVLKLITSVNEILCRKTNEWCTHWRTSTLPNAAASKAAAFIAVLRSIARKAEQPQSPPTSASHQAEVAATFPTGTSKGGDLWPPREIGECDDIEREEFGKIVADANVSMSPPMQCVWSIINLLAKAAGGWRCICTMPTWWRNGTRSDREAEQAFNRKTAHQDDTAQENKSCLTGAEQRLIDQEVFSMLGLHCLVILWDATKFYDYMNYKTLAAECTALGYGAVKTVMTLIMHAAPRVMKIGRAFVSATASQGQGIVAGCIRSLPLARIYTQRAVDKVRALFPEGGTSPSVEHPGFNWFGSRIYQHVDDLTQVIWAPASSMLAAMGAESALAWLEQADNLGIEVSSKSCIVPDVPAAHYVRHRLLTKGLAVSVKKHAVDVGTDTTSGSGRKDNKLRSRGGTAASKAARAAVLAGVDPRAKLLSTTNVKPTQQYGVTAYGWSPSLLS